MVSVATYFLRDSFCLHAVSLSRQRHYILDFAYCSRSRVLHVTLTNPQTFRFEFHFGRQLVHKPVALLFAATPAKNHASHRYVCTCTLHYLPKKDGNSYRVQKVVQEYVASLSTALQDQMKLAFKVWWHQAVPGICLVEEKCKELECCEGYRIP